MRLQFLFFALLALVLAGCSSTSTSDITGPGTIASGIKSCIRSTDASVKVPAGTKAIRKSDSAVVSVDANGCYEFAEPVIASGFLARSLAEGDSVQLYNDSALFAITLPYINGSDTVSIVPTIVTLQNSPNAEVDSVHLVVYDKVRMLSRKVKLRKADYGDSSSYSRTLWSKDDGSAVLVHFQINGVRTFASSVYTVEPGSFVYLNWNKIKNGAVPALIHGTGTYTDSTGTYKTLAYAKIDTVVDTSVKFIKLRAKSIYGITQINAGVDSIDVSSIITQVGISIPVTMTDSAGYVEVDTIRIIRNNFFMPISGCSKMEDVTFSADEHICADKR